MDISKILKKPLNISGLNFYNPNAESNIRIIYSNKESAKKATIGEISSIPTGGISFLNGAKNISLKALNDLKGSLDQSILGIQVNKMLINKSKNIKSNIRPIAIEIIIILSTNEQHYHIDKFFLHQYFRQLRIIIFVI